MIMVENKGEIALAGIRLLGLSDKPKDKIGQFGTGLKEAICLLMRLDAVPIIFSGLHRIDFSIQTFMAGIEEVCFKVTGPEPSEDSEGHTQPELDPEYGNDMWHGMGMHPNFGKHDWTEPWQALREIFCNAIDAGGIRMTMDQTAPVIGEKGFTKIYIPRTDALATSMIEIPVRLLALSNRVAAYSCEYGKCYVRPAEGGPKIYTKGVYIQEAEVNGLFDYELADLQLTESRSADWFDCYIQIAKIVTSDAAILHKVIKFSQTKEWDSSLEKSAIHFYGGGSRGIWMAAFNTFGERAIAVTTKHQAELVAARGYSPISVSHEVYDRMKHHGAQTASSVLGTDEAEGCEFETVPVEMNKFANKLWAKLVELHIVQGHMQRPRLEVFRNLAKPELEKWYKDGVIGVSTDIVGSHRMKLAILEGFMRVSSNSHDLSRNMQDTCVNALLLALRLA